MVKATTIIKGIIKCKRASQVSLLFCMLLFVAYKLGLGWLSKGVILVIGLALIYLALLEGEKSGGKSNNNN